MPVLLLILSTLLFIYCESRSSSHRCLPSYPHDCFMQLSRCSDTSISYSVLVWHHDCAALNFVLHNFSIPLATGLPTLFLFPVLPPVAGSEGSFLSSCCILSTPSDCRVQTCTMLSAVRSSTWAFWTFCRYLAERVVLSMISTDTVRY